MHLNSIFYKSVISILLIIAFNYSNAQNTIAFPGAKGCGKYTTGGKGGEVIYVSNLNNEGDGSLRYALEKTEGPRTIVFNVAGNIFLKSNIEIRHGNVTIAGQTAPGDGICVAGSGLVVHANNVIIRYMRFRPGDINHRETDALSVIRSKNVIVDHCSMSWSLDETCSCYDNVNFTLQNCIISESLNNSYHEKGKHGYGGIWGGMGATFHHNLLMHHTSRNPRLHGSRYHKQPEKERAEFVNNVIYNWRMKCIYAGEDGNYNLSENYFKPGPATKGKVKENILEPWEPFSNYYYSNNYIEGNEALTQNNHLAVLMPDEEISEPLKWLDAPLKISDYKVEDAQQAYLRVLANAGASLKRDAIDQRLIEEVKNGTVTYNDGILDSQEEVGGWPELKSAAAPKDTDQDGIPDEWESKNHLNPKDNNDHKSFDLSKEYTNLEVYLNSIVSQ